MINCEINGGYNYVGGRRIYNPIPALLSEYKPVGIFSKGNSVVPYATFSQHNAHRLLSLLYELYEAAPTQKSIASKIIRAAFGGGMDLQRKTRTGFVVESQAVSDDIKTQFAEYLESIDISVLDFQTLASQLYTDEVRCGTQFLHVRIAQKDESFSVSMRQVDTLNVLRLYDSERKKDILSNSVIVSEKPIVSGDEVTKDSSWAVVPLFPLIQERGGVVETVFQLNAEGYEGKFYGRSPVNTFWNYIDYEAANYTGKVSHSETTVRLLAMLKNPYSFNDEDAIRKKREFTNSLRRSMTNSGEGNSIGTLFYDEEAPTIFPVPVNRDYNFLKLLFETSEKKIAAGLGYDPRLAGLQNFQSGIGSNLYLQTLASASEFTIKPLQHKYIEFFDKVLGFIYEQTGENRFWDFSIKYDNMLRNLIKELRELESPKQNFTQQSNVEML